MMKLKILEVAEEKGMERGRAEGIERGIERGLSQGKLDVARNMLKRGVPIADIIEDTGLTQQEITNA